MKLKCKDVVRTVSSTDELSWFKRAEIQFHLLMCEFCRNYVRQISILKSSAKDWLGKKDSAQSDRMNRLKRDILNKINSKS